MHEHQKRCGKRDEAMDVGDAVTSVGRRAADSTASQSPGATEVWRTPSATVPFLAPVPTAPFVRCWT